MKQSPLLEVTNLKTTFRTPMGPVDVVNDISFKILPGESVGIVGESGSGKTMTSLSVMGLLPQPAGRVSQGTIFFEGQNVLQLSPETRRKLRGGPMSMIFQDPMSSLSPFYSVGFQIREAIHSHQKVSKTEAQQKTLELLADVGIPDPTKRVHQYPHQFSGGMRQRIMIAMALANHPKLLIADEPTTALDVTIQAQVLSLIAEKRRERNMALLLISHDWGVVSALCERVIVMYGGRIVEEGTRAELWENPLHPYTRALLKSVPHWDMAKDAELFVIPGNPPSQASLLKGCPFAPRCPQAKPSCHTEVPPEKVVGERRRYRCIL